MIRIIVPVILLSWTAFSQQHRYPVEDFYHRNLMVPIDHFNASEGSFSLYYELSTNFKFDQPTIFFLIDQQQSYGEVGRIDVSNWAQFDSSFNLVFIEVRGRQYSYIDASKADGAVDWERVYRLLCSRQMVEDIECVRRDLFKDHPESKVFIFARSGGGYIAQEYLAKYGNHIQRAYLQCAPNPIIMRQLGYVESKSLVNALNAADPSLHDKLKTVLKKKIVPELHLLWMLYRIRFAVEKPDSIYRAIISDLSKNDTTSYQEYMKKGFDYSKAKGTQTAIWKQMGYGIVMSPLQCDGYYMLGDPPDYVDPIYACLGDLSAPVIQLVRQKKVPPPEYPPLEQFRGITTEVFYQGGYYDHITPYQVGIELRRYFRYYELFIAEDDHMMMKHKDCYPKLRNAFFKYGIGSRELQEARTSADCREWKFQ
jgi:pimeloyl-ACP methyl ester carboxylesterase